MNPRRWLVGLAIVLILTVAGWFGWQRWHRPAETTRPASAEIAVDGR